MRMCGQEWNEGRAEQRRLSKNLVERRLCLLLTWMFMRVTEEKEVGIKRDGNAMLMWDLGGAKQRRLTSIYQ